MKDPHRYDDMLYMPHHESKNHPRMSRYNRAAQFSPFAALTGYDDAIREEARYTDQKSILDENQKVVLDQKLQLLISRLHEEPSITVTYFQPDLQKEGGSYQDISGTLKKINTNEQSITFYDADGIHDGINIMIEQIRDMQSDLFRDLEPY